MRVLQFLPSIESSSGGPVRSTVTNCRALHATAPDLQTELVTTDHGLTDGWGAEVEERLPDRMGLGVFPSYGSHTTCVSPALLMWCWRNVASFDLVVIRPLLHPLSSAVARIARYRGVPYLVEPLGTLSRWTFQHRRTRLKRTYYRLVERETLGAAAILRFTSEWEREDAKRLDIPCPTVVLPHVYEPKYSVDSEEESRQATTTNRILFLSRLHPMKGVDILLEAFALARRELSSLQLTVAGSGTAAYERNLKRQTHELGIEDSTEFVGHVTGSRKRDLLQASTVFVLPSHRESFGVAVIEALDAGLPVILSPDVGVARDVASAGAGLVVKRDAASLAATLIGVVADENRRGAMGTAGPRFVRDRYSPQVVGPKLHRVYRSAAESGPFGPPADW